MRTNIDIDDGLLKGQASILKLRGKVTFFGDVEDSRLDRLREGEPEDQAKYPTEDSRQQI